MTSKVYHIEMKPHETWMDFCTRVANEIQIMDCKIVSCNIDPRDGVCTILYINREKVRVGYWSKVK